MGSLMPRVITRTYNAYSRQNSPLRDGFTHAKSENKIKYCTLEEDTALSEMGPLMLRVKTRTYNCTLKADTAHS